MNEAPIGDENYFKICVRKHNKNLNERSPDRGRKLKEGEISISFEIENLNERSPDRGRKHIKLSAFRPAGKFK